MNRYAVVVAAGSVLLGSFVACSAYDESTPAPSPAVETEGGIVADAASEAASDADGSPAPDGMVLVATATSSFAIDAREVTVGQWTSFRDTHPFATTQLPDVCSWKTSFGPNSGGACLVDEASSNPIHCVDWCDAFAYCAAAGKRLCGRIGGASVDVSSLADPSLSQWTRACAGGTNADRWPYGLRPKPGTCNTAQRDAGAVLAAGSLAGCVGGVEGLFDMTGNVSEWNDACQSGDGGADGDQCATRGGSYVSALDPACNEHSLVARRFEGRTIGFRCCKDL